jgi:hypothetical protein
MPVSVAESLSRQWGLRLKFRPSERVGRRFEFRNKLRAVTARQFPPNLIRDESAPKFCIARGYVCGIRGGSSRRLLRMCRLLSAIQSRLVVVLVTAFQTTDGLTRYFRFLGVFDRSIVFT